MVLSNDCKIAFIGTGIMGAPIAGHLLDAGYSLTVHNRTREKADGLVARGAVWADTPAKAARDADVVFTMLGYPSDVEDVYLATDGLIRASKKGAWLIDLTTSSPQLARDIHDAAEVEDRHAFDCPVTGGQQGAIDGTLTLIAGITSKDAKPVLPLLQTFSSQIYWFERAGAGQTAKLCNQISLAASLAGAAEMLAVAEQSGISPELVAQMVGAGMGGSVQLSRVATRALEGDYAPGFLAEHLRKDLMLALATAEDLELTLPETETSFNLIDMLCQAGGSRKGTQAVTLLYTDEATSTAAGLDWSLLKAEPQDADPARQRYYTGTKNL
ncbi:MAG: NAD(P)-dependent oxidoreductase [Atopobiaceae bacterium]|nr:NAD(P)-dependent oxidoreductase [Atopobiaceae bacterium]